MNDLDARLRAVEDRQAISELRAHYCHVLDARDWDALATLFTADGEFQGLAHVTGRDAIHRFFSTTVDRLAEGFWHFCTNATVQLDGDTATGRISMQYLSVKKGVSYVSAGHYDDELRREDGLWRFRKRQITFYYHAPLSEGFVGSPQYITPEGLPLPPRA
ncbi:nuclear transport factor 2 family protein [Paracoccus sp. MC1854]|uniref:nuclear transport factor 2 family protein n=1 Tax=Paracoccus sp. MC1854 TaxID=2760306 RepID=UPI0016007868|nr:nuclear transport factor 2 family protein [Paracoccus sp. MC1854]MBB1492318.1 nuclear transport factor 2 family protein [Paracoccus sp. MC1854]